MAKKLFTLICCAAAILTSRSQIFTQVIDEQELSYRVKQIDEFFMRFNNEVDYTGKPITSSIDSVKSTETDSILRFKTLASLLNLDKYARNSDRLDSISSEFVDYIINNNITLHYEDTTWCALVTCSCLYYGKNSSITLEMRPEHVKDVVYKWVISDVKGQPVSCMTDSCNMNISIFPGVHGSGFITIPEFVNLNSSNVRALFAKGYEPSSLAAFEYLVKTSNLKLKSITDVKYLFHTPMFNFSVERFSKKDSYNNGWLINSIEKNPQNTEI